MAETTKPTTQSPPSTNPPTPHTDNSVLTRFKRTISNSNYFNQKSSPKSSQPTSPSAAGSTTTATTPSSQTSGSTGANMTSFEKFMALSKKKKDGDSTFPPPHWFEEVPPAPTYTAPENIESRLPSVPEETPSDPALKKQSRKEEELDAIALAQKIKSMISSLPDTPAASPSPGPNATSSAKGSEVLPNYVHDPSLISLLSSPLIMNGSIERGRESVWRLLDKMNVNIPGLKPSPKAGTNTREMKSEETPADEEDRSSIMLYAPLIPDANSKVEVAPSTVIHDDKDHHHHHQASSSAPATPKPGQGSQSRRKSRLSTLWPFHTSTGSVNKGKGAAEKERIEERLHVRKFSDHRIWIPSKEKISLEVTWWGYRIYLPPPVLAVLDNKKVEGAKRAAMVTTSLKWLLDRVPVAVVPPQMRATMKLMKALVPYLGYVGVFVAWSWNAIKSFDKGNGVVLTATWLLSVALVPGTWEDTDFPAPPPSTRAEPTATGTPPVSMSPESPGTPASPEGPATGPATATPPPVVPETQPKPDTK